MGRLAVLCLLLCACDAPGVTDPSGKSATAAGSTTTAAVFDASAPTSASGRSAPTSTASSSARPPEVTLKIGGDKAVKGPLGMVSSEDANATKIGVDILARGGNAIDAAVAIGYALSVTHHAAGSLGGGGFMIVHLKSGETLAIDYREMAPARATVALNNKQLKGGAHGYLSAAVPGVVAGLNLARDRYGTMPLSDLVTPAADMAANGHAYGARQSQVLGWYWKRIRKDPTLRAIFGRGDKRERPVRRGEQLKQPALARTLRTIAAKGTDGFYKGAVAAKIVKAMKHNGGLVSEADLAAYQAKIRKPLHLNYRGLDVFTMSPPSMGGVALYAIMMNLAQSQAHLAPPGSSLSLHYFIEASKRAYADRRSIGADPDSSDMASRTALREKLLSAKFYRTRKPVVTNERATPSEAIDPIHKMEPQGRESPDTTHFSVVDKYGNAVSCTTTLSAAFGAWIVVPETGVLFSNAMGAFSPAGVNQLRPGKRMASSMTPTIVVSGGKAVAVIGSPGGDTIPNTVSQVLRNLVDYGMTIDQAIEYGRIHHQYKPDVVRVEKVRPPSSGAMAELTKMGHKLELNRLLIGDANGITVDRESGVAYGFADSRKGGLALGPTQ